MKHFFRFAVCTILLSIPVATHGTEFSVEPGLAHEGPGFTVQLIIQYDEPINALEGSVVFDSDALRVNRIIESPNGVPIWIEGPLESSPGVISFAGIFPGGIEPKLTDRLSVMDITFEVLVPGESSLVIEDAHVYLHKAIPEEDAVRMLPLSIQTSTDDLGSPIVPADDIAPESFSILISSDAAIHGGSPVAIFGTRDLQSGIAVYEIRERMLGIYGIYRQSVSPSELSPFWRWSIIDVRATDRAGNAIIARHIPITLVVTYILVGLLGIWRVRRTRRKRL